MKKIILSLFAATMVLAVKAQEIPERNADHPPMHHKMKGRHERHEMMKQLNLTDEQKEQFKKQREEFRKKMEELKKNDNITVKEWKSRMEALRKEQKVKMDDILTTEQKAKMETLKAQAKSRHEEMMKDQAERMKKEFNLTEEQSAKLDKQRAEMKEKMEAIRQDKNLSDEQKKEKVKELMKQRKETLKSILTEEQLKKMKEHKPGGPGRHQQGRQPV